jgi:hypothetical protein
VSAGSSRYRPCRLGRERGAPTGRDPRGPANAGQQALAVLQSLARTTVRRVTHLAFFETIAAVIPVLFLALVLEQRNEQPPDDFWDYFSPIAIAGLLFIGEVNALAIVFRGHGDGGDAVAVSIPTALAAFLLLVDAAIARFVSLEEGPIRGRLVRWSALTLLVVLLLTIVASVRPG